MGQYRRIGLTAKHAMEEKAAVLTALAGVLTASGAALTVDRERTQDVPALRTLPALEDGGAVDVIVAVGGDGTILQAVRKYGDLHVPFITVNCGSLGFMADLPLQQALRELPLLLAGKGCVDVRSRLRVTVRRAGTAAYAGTALNEAVVSQGAIARLIELQTRVNGEPLTTFHADGLIVATPTGSTAYSVAAGGPIVHPQLEALVLTAINPHSFSQKPLVLPGSSTVTVGVNVRERARDTEVGLSLDGQEYCCLQNGDTVEVALHEVPVEFLRSASTSFFGILRSKLRWGEPPDSDDAQDEGCS